MVGVGAQALRSWSSRGDTFHDHTDRYVTDDARARTNRRASRHGQPLQHNRRSAEQRADTDGALARHGRGRIDGDIVSEHRIVPYRRAEIDMYMRSSRDVRGNIQAGADDRAHPEPALRSHAGPRVDKRRRTRSRGREALCQPASGARGVDRQHMLRARPERREPVIDTEETGNVPCRQPTYPAHRRREVPFLKLATAVMAPPRAA